MIVKELLEVTDGAEIRIYNCNADEIARGCNEYDLPEYLLTQPIERIFGSIDYFGNGIPYIQIELAESETKVNNENNVNLKELRMEMEEGWI